MVKHAKKERLNRVWIIIFSALGIIFIASWIWLILFFPPISNRAEGFIKNNLGRIFNARSEELNITDEMTDAGVLNENLPPSTEDKGPEENISSAAESEQDKKPTINLVIDEGPLYNEEKDSCYYIVRAIVNGKPEPTVNFSKDDSSGNLGPYQAEINLNRNLKSYTLTATASNSSGTVMDSITLIWGCNSPPVVKAIMLSSDIVYINEQYELSVDASDAENDDMDYKWTVEGGTLENNNQKSVKWYTPAEADDYVVEVEVKDSSGGITTKSISVYVGTKQVSETTQPQDTSPSTTTTESSVTSVPPTTEPYESNINLIKNEGEGGYLEFGGQTSRGGSIYAGDSSNNKPCAGFLSFDISGLENKTVESATLTFSGVKSFGEPFSYLDAFWINVVDWGAEPIVQNDFTLTGIAIKSFTTSNISCNTALLRSEIQNAINSGKTRFQIRVHFSGPYTDNDSTRDGWEFAQNSINLNVTVR
jgi:hypothetical protein